MSDLKASQEIGQAIERIRANAGKATKGPWMCVVDAGVVRDPDATAVDDDSDPCGAGPPIEWVVQEEGIAHEPANGVHIALWDPDRAELVARLLEVHRSWWLSVEALESMPTDGRRVLPNAGEAAALDLARSINAAELDGVAL